MAKKQYRPIDKYDEAMENKEVKQSASNREYMQTPQYIKESNKYDDALENMYSIDNKGINDLKDLYDNAGPGYIDAMHSRQNKEQIDHVLSNPDLSNKAPIYIANRETLNYDNLLDRQGDLKNTYNTMMNRANTIKQDSYKYQSLQAERELKKLYKEQQEHENKLQRLLENPQLDQTGRQTEETRQKIQEIQSDIREEKRKNVEATMEIQELQDKIDKRTVDNRFAAIGQYLAEQESTAWGDYWMSGEMGEDLGGGLSDMKMLAGALATGYTSNKLAKYTKRLPGYWGKVVPPVVVAGGMLLGGGFAYKLREHESQAEAWGAYEQRLNDLKQRHKHSTGQEPTEKEEAKLHEQALKGMDAMYQQNMNLLAGDIGQIALMFLPWGKWMGKVGNLMSKVPGAARTSAWTGKQLNRLPGWAWNPRNANRLRNVSRAVPIMGANGFWEGFEEGYQYTIADKYKQDEYDNLGPGFFENLAPGWEAAGQAMPAVGQTLVTNPIRSLFGWTQHRYNDRTDSKEFRNSVRAGGLLGIFMGGGISLLQNSLDFVENKAVRQRYQEEFNFINDNLDKYYDSQQRSDRADLLWNVFEKDGGKRMLRALTAHEDYVKQEGLTDETDMLEYNNIRSEVADLKGYYDLLQGDRYKHLSKEDKIDAMRAYSHMRHVKATNIAEAAIADKEAARIAKKARKGVKDDATFELWQLAMNVLALKNIGASHRKTKPNKETFGSPAFTKFIKDSYIKDSSKLLKEAEAKLKEKMKELGIKTIPQLSENDAYVEALERKNGGLIGSTLSDDVIADMLDANKASKLKSNPFYLDIKEWKKQRDAYHRRKAKELDEYKNSTKAEDQNINEGDQVWTRSGLLKGKYIIKNGIKGIENQDGFHPLDQSDINFMERRIPNSEKIKDIKSTSNRQRTDVKDRNNPENNETGPVKDAAKTTQKTKDQLVSVSSTEDKMIDDARKGDKEAQRKFELYGLNWLLEPIFRFIGKSEVDALLNGETIEGKNKKFGVDVTKDQSGEKVPATTTAYRVSFKTERGLDDKKSGSRVRMKNEQDGWIPGGYTIEDVAKIEKRNEDGTWTTIYSDQEYSAPIAFKLQESEDFSYKHHPNIQAGKEDDAVNKFVNDRSREDLKNLIVQITEINTEGVPSNIKALLAKKEPIDENVDLRNATVRNQFGRNLKVKIKLTDPRTNKSVETYLYNIVSTSEMQESDNIITTFKNILNARILNEGPLYGAISYVDFGKFNNVEGQKASISKIFGKNKSHLAYNDGKGITDGINPYFNVVENGAGKGRLYAIFTDPVDNTSVPIKLNNRNLNQKEAEELFSIVEQFLNSTTSNPFTFTSLYKDTNLTVSQYMSLLTFVNDRSELAEDNFELEQSRPTVFGFNPATSGRSAHFQFGAYTINKNMLDTDRSKVYQSFIKHVLNTKKRQAHAGALNRSLFDLPFIQATGVTEFTFMGKKYKKGENDNYNKDFIEGDRVLTTDIEVLPNGRIQKDRRLVLDMYEFSGKPPVLKDEKKQEKLPDDLKGVDDTPINDEEFNEDMFDWTMETSLVPSPKEVLNEKDARAYLDKVLGNAVPVRIKDKLVKLGSNGMEVYAAFTDGVMQLSRMAPLGAEYHEAYHVVETAYLTPGEVAALNRETVKKHGEPTKNTLDSIKKKYSKWKLTDKEARQVALSEIRAEEYRLYESSVQDDRLTFKNITAKIKKWFNELLDYIVPMFSTTRASKIYSRISRGYYRKDQTPNKVFSISIKDFSKSVEETALEEAGFNIHDRNDIAISLIQALVTNKGVNNINDLKDIKITDNILLGYLGFLQKKRAEAGNKSVANNLEIIKDNIKHFFNSEDKTGLIPDILSQYKITLVTDEDVKGNKDVSQAMSNHFEYSGKDNANTNTKILLSFLSKRNKKGEVMVNDRTGLNEVERFSIVWNTIEKALADTVSYAEYNDKGEIIVHEAFDLMMDKLNDLAKLVPTFAGLSSKIKQLNENDQIRFFNAFSKTSMNFVTGIVDKWAYQMKEEGSEELTNVEQSSTRFIDPAVQGRKFMIRKEWLENLKQSKFFILKEEDEKLNVNEKVLDTILESWTRMSTAYRTELKRMTRDMDTKVSEKYKEGLIKDLKIAGINLSPMALDVLLKAEISEVNSLKTLFLGKERNFGLQDIYIRTTKSKKTGRNPYDFSSIKVRATKENAPMDLNFSENNPFSWANSALNMLAEAEALVNNNMGQSNILGPQGKSYWLYSLNSYLTKFSNKLAASPYESKTLLDDRWAKSSLWLKEILSGNLLKIRTFNNLKLSNSKDEGTGNTDLTPSQEHAFRINSTLQNIARQKGLLSPPTMADKSVWNLIEGMSVYDVFENADSGFQLKPDGTMRIGDNIARKFALYAIGEISRVQQVTEDLFGKNKLSNSQLIKYYHYNGTKDDKGRRKANGLKFILFPSITTKVLKSIGVMTEDGVFLENWDSDLVVPQLTNFVKRVIEERIMDEINFAIANGVITKTPGREEGTSLYKNNTISTKILKEHKNKYTTKGGQFREHYGVGLALANYTVNNMIGFIETTKVFSQDPAFYKNLDDLSKRFPELIASGQDLKIIKGYETFNVAIIEDQILPKSQYYDNYLKFLIEKKGMPKAEAEEILKPYLNVNVTDAQAYITLPRWRSLMRMLGKWNDNYDSTYFRLLKGETVTDTNFDMLLAQPLKGMHFEVRKGPLAKDGTTNLNIPTYLKYSQAVLIPAAVKGTELGKLLEAMNTQGVDEVVFDSGIKVGALSPSNIMKDAQTGELSDNIILNPFVLKNEYWKLQQDLSPHKSNESLEGSQVKKNIIANIDLSAMYKVPTKIVNGEQEYKEISGQELVGQIHALDRALSDIEKDAMVKEWGITTEKVDLLTGQVRYFINDYSKLHGVLYNAFKAKKNTPKKLLESLALNSEGTGFAIDISSHPFMRDIENMLGAMITDRLIKLKMPGGSFIQQSNFGMQRMKKFTDLAQKDKIELQKQINERGLSPVYFSKNGTVKAQIFLPSWFKEKFVPGHEKMSNSQIKKYITDKRLLSGIGYRIPNQAMSSIDSFDIVGFLPKSMGDTVIVYDEFTSKTGADFDIDKLYIMLRSYAEGKKGIYYVNYDGTKSIEENRQSRGGRTDLFKKSLRNRKLELYESILASVNTFDQLINPLDSVAIKNDAATVRYLKEKANLTDSQISEIEASRDTDDFYSTVSSILASRKDLEFFSPQYQMKTKETFLGGKFGVAQEANQLVDHAISQWSAENIESSLFLRDKDIGLGHITPESKSTDLSQIYNVVGGLISNTMSGRLDAYVDIAKDPYIFYLNNNRITANTVALLDRAGVDPRWTNRFMGLKVLSDYVRTQNFINSPGSPGVRIGKKSIYKAEDVLLHRLKNKYSRLTGTDVKDIKIVNLMKEESRVRMYSRRNNISMEDAMARHTENPIRINDLITEKRLEQLLDSKTPDNSSKVYDQILLLNLFLNLRKVASGLNKVVNASKADTKGAQGGVVGAVISDNFINDVFEKDLIGGFRERFDSTMLGKYQENGPNMMLALFGETFLAGNANFRGIMKDLSELVGNERILLDEDLYRKVYSGFISYLFSKTEFYKNIDVDNILYAKDNVVNRLWRYKNQDNSPIKDNIFIKYLSPEFATTKRGHDYIITAASEYKEGIDKDSLTEGWHELLYHEDADVRIFAEDLYKFSILSSGFSNTLFSFHELAPLSYELDNNIYDQFGQQISNVKTHGNILFDQAELKNFLKTQTSNTELVPEHFAKNPRVLQIPGSTIKYAYHITLPSNTSKKFITREPKEGFKHFVPFIEVNIRGKQVVLMEHIGYNDKGDAIYQLTERSGTYTKGRKIFENPETRTKLKENHIINTYNGKVVNNWLSILEKNNFLSKLATKEAQKNKGEKFIALDESDISFNSDSEFDTSLQNEESFTSTISKEEDLHLMLTPDYVLEESFPVVKQTSKGPKVVGIFKSVGAAIKEGIKPEVAVKAAIKYNEELQRYLETLGVEPLKYDKERGNLIGLSEAWNKFKEMMAEGRGSQLFFEEAIIDGQEYFFDSRPLKPILDMLGARIPTNSAYHPILDIIMEVIQDQHVEVIYTDSKTLALYEDKKSHAFFAPDENKIFLPTDAKLTVEDHTRTEEELMVLLHEIVHQLTSKSLNKNIHKKTKEEKLFQKRVHKLLDLYIEKTPLKNMPEQLRDAVVKYQEKWEKMLPAEKENWNYGAYSYEMDNVLDEFLAYGLTFKKVKTQLENIKIQEEGPLFEGSILDNLIKSIVELFNALVDKVMGKNAKELLEASFTDFVKNNVSLERTITDIYTELGRTTPRRRKFFKEMTEKIRAKKKC